MKKEEPTECYSAEELRYEARAHRKIQKDNIFFFVFVITRALFIKVYKRRQHVL